LSTRF
jgi:hypothetical protein